MGVIPMIPSSGFSIVIRVSPERQRSVLPASREFETLPTCATMQGVRRLGNGQSR